MSRSSLQNEDHARSCWKPGKGVSRGEQKTPRWGSVASELEAHAMPGNDGELQTQPADLPALGPYSAS